MKTTIAKRSVLAASIGLASFIWHSSYAEDLFLVQEVPDPMVLADMMFPASSASAAAPKYKLRGIRFTDAESPSTTSAPAPAPASEPPNSSAEAAPPAQEGAPEGMAIGFTIQFAYNSPELLPDSLPYLDALGEMMNLERTRNARLLISGHADASGDEQYNLALSEARALAVADYLQQKYTVDGSRLKTVGLGESKPLPNTDPLDPSNRRVEFHPET